MSEEANEILTYEEIHELFPDEWVVLVDVELNGKTQEPLRGRVVSHDKELEKAHQVLDRYKDQSISFFYTGDIPEDMGILFHCL